MKTLLTLSLMAATAGAAVLLTNDLTQSFEKGQVFVTTIEMTANENLEDSVTLVGGNEMPMSGEMSFESTSSLNVSYTDTVRSTAGDRLASFERNYSQAEDSKSTQMTDPMGGDNSGDTARVSELVDIPIIFERGEDGFEASFPKDSDGDEAWLENLAATPDWGLLLPDSSAKVDDEWEVPAELLQSIREPGGDIVWEVQGEASGMRGEITAPPGAMEYSGDITATLVSIEDGIAVIELEFEIQTELDLTDFIPEDGIDLGEEGAGMPQPEFQSIMVEADTEGTGTVRWNIEDGHLESIILELESEEVQTTNLTLDMGQIMEIESINTTIKQETIEVTLTVE